MLISLILSSLETTQKYQQGKNSNVDFKLYFIKEK